MYNGSDPVWGTDSRVNEQILQTPLVKISDERNITMTHLVIVTIIYFYPLHNLADHTDQINGEPFRQLLGSD